MEKLNIIAYMKPSCGWSNGVRAVMQKYDLPFEDRDIINDPAQRQEMIQKTGQMLQGVDVSATGNLPHAATMRRGQRQYAGRRQR